MPGSLSKRLRLDRPLLLDGPTGTELARRGVSVAGPSWSARALRTDPDVVARIHADYEEAGAEVVTANTFRTHARNLAGTNETGQARELTARAVELARQATGGRTWVAGSQAPLEDCYRPDLTPPDTDLDREHEAMSRFLVEAGVDLILVETQPTIREAVAAVRTARATGLPVLVSFVCGDDSRLLSGESLDDAARAVMRLKPAGVLVNCLPVDAVAEALNDLLNSCGQTPTGAYANAGIADPKQGWQETRYRVPAEYAAAAGTWIDRGARIIGGCCGTTPQHIAALGQRLNAGGATESL